MKVVLGENDHLVIEVEGTDGMFIVSYGKEVKDALTVHCTMPGDDGRCDLIYYSSYGEPSTDEEGDEEPVKPVRRVGTKRAKVAKKSIHPSDSYSTLNVKKRGRNVFRRTADGELVLAIPAQGIRKGGFTRDYLNNTLLSKMRSYIDLNVHECRHNYLHNPYKAWLAVHPVVDAFTGMEIHIDYVDASKETSAPSGCEYAPGVRDSEVLEHWKTKGKKLHPVL